MFDLAIIGGGPAALSAAIYAARAGLSVKIYEKSDFGGIVSQIAVLENYPGFTGAGKDLATSMRSQAERAGATLEYGECTSVQQREDGSHELIIDESSVLARAVLVATGSEPKRLSFDLNIPVSYCALCDGAFAKDKDIVVVGGANSAIQEALYLANLAKTVTIITHSALKADRELLDRLPRHANIKVIEHLEPTRELLEQYAYCFVYIGKLPATSFLDGAVLSPTGYIITDIAGKCPHQTIKPGLFAAGDVREGSTKQIVTAAADGVLAALEIIDFLRNS